jgi:hypothetical protein
MAISDGTLFIASTYLPLRYHYETGDKSKSTSNSKNVVIVAHIDESVLKENGLENRRKSCKMKF